WPPAPLWNMSCFHVCGLATWPERAFIHRQVALAACLFALSSFHFRSLPWAKGGVAVGVYQWKAGFSVD
ncbi:hypothetical protein, partial [Pseudomonas protegens]|uniref:hypothetical protein n=1 Tax=Pseudomonas protegens TaxID=380021 RepID=UPI001C828F37